MTGLKVIVACASLLVFVLVGLVAVVAPNLDRRVASTAAVPVPSITSHPSTLPSPTLPPPSTTRAVPAVRSTTRPPTTRPVPPPVLVIADPPRPAKTPVSRSTTSRSVTPLPTTARLPVETVRETIRAFASCAAVRAAGRAPLLRGEPGYSRKLDRDGDGRACE